MPDRPRSEKINHVVVLMFENRSFDHMLGLLDHPKLPTVLDEPLPNPLDPAHPKGTSYTAFELDGYDALTADPKHGFPDVMRQLTGHAEPWKPPYKPSNTGFAWNFHARRGASGTQVLGCYSPRLLPILSTLAREYAVCSRWFCSVPSETWPNRLFAHAASSDNLLENDERPYTNRTIFEALSDVGRSWQVYAGDIPQVLCFPKLLLHGARFSRLNDFMDQAKSGHLPNYSFIEPRHFGGSCSSQHPLAKVLLGERLLADVYNAIASKKNIWESTLLIITYDEHGGVFDRIPPPSGVPPHAGKKDAKYGFAFDLLGPRVPAVVISPWIEPFTVDDQAREHTTIMATLRDAFACDETLTDRDAAATGLAHLLTRKQPRGPVSLPALPAPRGAELGPAEWAEGVAPDGTIILNDLQQQLIRMAQRIEAEQPVPRAPELSPPPQPPFESEAELGEFVEDFRQRLTSTAPVGA